MIKAPQFWYKKPGILVYMLYPFALLYSLLRKIKVCCSLSSSLSIPVISVGNLVCGGAGKTPTAITIAALLQDHNHRVHFVTRGYGGEEKGPLLVDSNVHTYQMIGDEALLLARQSPTWMARNRYEGGIKACEAGASVVILDDGHQQTYLYRTISFLVVDSYQQFGNTFELPAGPLREDLKQGLDKSEAIILIGEGNLIIPYSKPIFRAKRELIYDPLLEGKEVIAFAGLGFNQQFFNALGKLSVNLKDTFEFPDHHPYSYNEVENLIQKAKKNNARLVTTRKDFMRIPYVLRGSIDVIDLSIQFDNPSSIVAFINNILEKYKK